MGSNCGLKDNNIGNKTNTTLPTTLFSTKASKVQIRKSLSSPTNGLPEPISMIPSNTQLLKKEVKKPASTKTTMSIPPGSNKNKKRNQTPNHLNTRLSNISHVSSPPNASSSTTNTHNRPNLRLSASSRFGKNLLPTWLGGHATEEGCTSPTSSIHSNSSSGNLSNTPPTPTACTISSFSKTDDSTESGTSDLEKAFETLLVR